MVLELSMSDYADLTNENVYAAIEASYRLAGDERVMVKLPYELKDAEGEQDVLDSVHEHFSERYDTLSTFLEEETKGERFKRYVTHDMWVPENGDYTKQVSTGMLGLITAATAATLPFTWELLPMVGLAGFFTGVGVVSRYQEAKQRDQTKLGAYQGLAELDIEFVYG